MLELEICSIYLSFDILIRADISLFLCFQFLIVVLHLYLKATPFDPKLLDVICFKGCG